jgi:hypothetical protein
MYVTADNTVAVIVDLGVLWSPDDVDGKIRT